MIVYIYSYKRTLFIQSYHGSAPNETVLSMLKFSAMLSLSSQSEVLDFDALCSIFKNYYLYFHGTRN